MYFYGFFVCCSLVLVLHLVIKTHTLTPLACASNVPFDSLPRRQPLQISAASQSAQFIMSSQSPLPPTSPSQPPAVARGSPSLPVFIPIPNSKATGKPCNTKLNPYPGNGNMSVRLREVVISNCSTSAFQATVAQLDTFAFFKARCALSSFHQAAINCDFLLDSDWSRYSIRCSIWKRCFWRHNFRCYLLHKLHRWHDHLCIDHLNGRSPHSDCHRRWR